jgi:hypothetical protein
MPESIDRGEYGEYVGQQLALMCMRYLVPRQKQGSSDARRGRERILPARILR